MHVVTLRFAEIKRMRSTRLHDEGRKGDEDNLGKRGV